MKNGNYKPCIPVILSLLSALAVSSAIAGPQSKDIQALFSGEDAFTHIENLVSLGPRVAGSDAEQDAASYIAAEMESYGLEVEIQAFEILYFEELSEPALEQISPLPEVYAPSDDFLTMTASGAGDVTASLAAVDIMIPPGPDPNDSTSGCESADFASFPVGSIALIQRGTCSYLEKASNAQYHGAVGVIIFNEGQDGRTDVIRGTLGGPGVAIPVIGTSYDLGAELYGLPAVTMRLKVDAITEERISQNVIGTSEGLQAEQGIVYLGGHYDSVSSGPGANDNASGVAAILESARLLAKRPTKATMKFLAFGAKEMGLDGSYWYVAENYTEITTLCLGMINLDKIAVGDTLFLGNEGVAPDDLLEYTETKADGMGLAWENFVAEIDSDHHYFEMVGCPVSFLTQGPDPYYHTPEDTPDKIQIDALEKNGELATAVLYDWAKNPAKR